MTFHTDQQGAEAFRFLIDSVLVNSERLDLLALMIARHIDEGAESWRVEACMSKEVEALNAEARAVRERIRKEWGLPPGE